MSKGNGKSLKWVGTRPIRPDGVDKVTGRAKFGADTYKAGMLTGAVLRSPHAHARIKSIDTSKAAALQGVKAIVTGADFPELSSEFIPAGEMMVNYRDMSLNIIARNKVLYDGHAIAAVAATSASIAEEALTLIKVDYEVLPHVIDVVEAMEPGAPILHDDLFTDGVDPKPTKASNVAKRIEIKIGDVEDGFTKADVVLEREFNTQPVHQGYIELHACTASVSEDGYAELWCSTQGHFVARAHCARLLGMDISKIRVTSSEIGGGFGGKTVVYLEPLALALSRIACQPVHMVMPRTDLFRATGPTSGANMVIKIGATKDGKITAGEAVLKFQAGAYAGSPVQPAAMCAFAPYDLENVKVVGYDVVTNRPKVAAYRAPGAPISGFAVESMVDELAKKLDIDPVELRLKNAAKEGTRAAYGPKFGPVGLVETLNAVKDTKHYKTKLGPNQGRGVASGFWFNIGGETSASMILNEDGTIELTVGTPDIGGSRASMAMMAAEELGIDMAKIRPRIGDTSSIGYTFLTGGSRATFSSGMAVVQASRTMIDEMRDRAAKIWDISVDAVEWEDGQAKPAGSNAGDFEPMSLNDLAKAAGKTGGAIAGHAEINAQGAGPSFGTHLVDVEVDPDTGHVKVLRYTAAQDAGKAIHPAYVEGQIQGGAVQGVGWALNEEYIYSDKGLLENAGFLDYRIPVASDLPMIDAIIVEVPNPTHPYGVRGVGETPIIPPMAAIANAINGATNVRFSQLPMSPPVVLKGLSDAQ
ncbi:MAG: xanthine dehydrogenase family protein molybdopterin-binding subunit [Rhodospirillaceae bacterium]|jgi:CO/xanthine dehydrogenase Mo-binding subunit|nr:xanthine dehydrogenase family protein molybdopterin-binding subunit [Rhodospirillaceae bacterium]MBT5664141.1 xanthine dehydrogenase family protein molybdopterin-binding subunit [Rhodospirillaceae bacterium]MBT5812568.1 xanthine dehydrogenase family protein molybdopterin-binding subunit [Rhodospirillaceae bacterium]